MSMTKSGEPKNGMHNVLSVLVARDWVPGPIRRSLTHNPLVPKPLPLLFSTNRPIVFLVEDITERIYSFSPAPPKHCLGTF